MNARRTLLLWAVISLWPGMLAAQANEAEAFRVFEADPATFVVARPRSGGRGVEGFVVDRDALVESLRTRVLDQQGLGALARVAAVVDPGSNGSLTRVRASGDAARYLSFQSAYSFSHRFAAPFERVQAKLDLAPLGPEGVAGELLYPLTAMLALAIVFGLYALYRMVAAQVRFAQRRSSFVAAVSHELKTPLTAIRMYGEMLRDDLVESEDKRREYYATISAETERLSRLINNVLELSRLERDERSVELVVGDLTVVIGEVLEILRPHAEREGFRIEFSRPSALPAARFDRDALTQVLFNLVDNALKYGRSASERVIRVRCEPTGDAVCVCVSDYGPGVDAAQIGAIFEPFYRAQAELTRKQQGTGIGLALVRGLVQRMHGHVEACNLSPGFEVRVTLPIA